MEPTLTIGDFSRATHLSVKMLRHYHDIGLLEPADVDRYTGCRRYATAQIGTAQVIRRFRDLDMPLEEINAVLSALHPQTASSPLSPAGVGADLGSRPKPHSQPCSLTLPLDG